MGGSTLWAPLLPMPLKYKHVRPPSVIPQTTGWPMPSMYSIHPLHGLSGPHVYSACVNGVDVLNRCNIRAFHDFLCTPVTCYSIVHIFIGLFLHCSLLSSVKLTTLSTPTSQAPPLTVADAGSLTLTLHSTLTTPSTPPPKSRGAVWGNFRAAPPYVALVEVRGEAGSSHWPRRGYSTWRAYAVMSLPLTSSWVGRRRTSELMTRGYSLPHPVAASPALHLMNIAVLSIMPLCSHAPRAARSWGRDHLWPPREACLIGTAPWAALPTDVQIAPVVQQEGVYTLQCWRTRKCWWSLWTQVWMPPARPALLPLTVLFNTVLWVSVPSVCMRQSSLCWITSNTTTHTYTSLPHLHFSHLSCNYVSIIICTECSKPLTNVSILNHVLV